MGAFGVTFTTHYRGGCLECRFRVPAQGNEPQVGPTLFGAEYDIQLNDRFGCFWRGKLTGMRFQETPQGRYWDLTCSGYSVGLGEAFDTAYNARNKTIDTIITDALAIAATAWEETSITTGGHTISNSADVFPNVHGAGAIRAAQLIAWGARFDEGAQWGIWANNDGTRRFLYKPRPSAPTLYLRMQDWLNRDWGYSRSPLFNEVQAEYARAGTVSVPTYSYTTSTDGDSVTEFGARMFAVRLWELSALADADRVCDAVLAVAKRPRMNATLFETVADEYSGLLAVRDLNNLAAVLPPHRIQAGELVAFVDMPVLDEASLTTDFNRIAMIAQTEYDEETATLRLTPEAFTDTIGGYLARFEAVAAGLLQ
jgi:hypothetical protein